MITYVKGNLFESPARVLVNTVNTVGVMGKGIAKTFKEIYPEMFSQYQRLCERKDLQVGKLWLYKTDHKWILSFPTKAHWRQSSKAEYVEVGLKKFASTYSSLGITSVAFPQLGCGNGELDWEKVVQPLMTMYLSPLPIDIFIYEYTRDSSLAEHRDIEGMHAWLRSESRSLAFEEMWSDLLGIIGSRIVLRRWDGSADFAVTVTYRPESGLQFLLGSQDGWSRLVDAFSRVLPHKWRPRILGPGYIYVPREAMLDLWQNIRAYGFCVSRLMPQGLDTISVYVVPLLARLGYMRKVELSLYTKQAGRVTETGLQLFALPLPRSTRLPQSIYSVQPV